MALMDKIKKVKVPSWMRKTVSGLALLSMTGGYDAAAAPKLESSPDVDRVRKELGIKPPQAPKQKKVQPQVVNQQAVDPLDFPTLDELRARDYSDKKIRGVKRVSSGYIAPYSAGRVNEIVDMVLNNTEFDEIFEKAGNTYGVPPVLLKIVCAAESNLNPNAGNKSGAKGIAQIVGNTSDYLGLKRSDRFDPEKAIEKQAKYFAHLLARANGDIYNAKHRGALNYYHGFSTSAHKQYAENISASIIYLDMPSSVNINYVMKVVHSPKTGKLVDVDREEFIAMNTQRYDAKHQDLVMLAYQADLEKQNAEMLAVLAKDAPEFSMPSVTSVPTFTASAPVSAPAAADNLVVAHTSENAYYQTAMDVVKPASNTFIGPMPLVEKRVQMSAKNNEAQKTAPAAKPALQRSERVDQFRAQIQRMSTPVNDAAPPHKPQDLFASSAKKMVYNDQNRAANLAGHRYAHILN